MNLHFQFHRKFVVSFMCSLALLLCSWNSNLSALDLAEVPLTRATPQSQNLDKKILDEALVRIARGDYGKIYSLLVTRNNYLVIESYFSTYRRGDLQRLHSATKSVSSALIGIAVKQGKIESVQKKVLDFFPEYENIKYLDSLKKNISLESVLTMTSGTQWDESSISYLNPDNDAMKMFNSPNSIRYVLDLPMSKTPGSAVYLGKFVYNSGDSMLLSGILKNSTGHTAEVFASDHLFKPLGISKWYWSTVFDGTPNTAWGLSLRPLDMARFGILFLNQGRWLGNQVFSREWGIVSTRKHVDTTRIRHGSVDKRAYGYQWWRFVDDDPIVSDLTDNDIYYAFGYGGQFIMVIPHLRMVVISTGDNPANHTIFFEVLRDYIFPAVLD